MLKMCEKVTKIFRSHSTAMVRTDFVRFSRRFSILDIRSRFQSPFSGLINTRRFALNDKPTASGKKNASGLSDLGHRNEKVRERFTFAVDSTHIRQAARLG